MSSRPTRSSLSRLADWAFRRRAAVVIAWVVALVGAIGLSSAFSGEFSADYSTAGSESKAASDLIANRFPGRSDESVDVVWQSPAGADSPAVRARMDAYLAEASTVEGIGQAAGPPAVSPDGTIAVARLQLTETAGAVPKESYRTLIDRADALSTDGLRVELGGPGVGDAAAGSISSEGIGLALAALILLMTFGSLIAAGLPLATAIVGLGISSSLIGLLTNIVDVPDWATSVAAMIGIGVGIDYALLIITRFRNAMGDGLEPRDALGVAIPTAGRAVLVAGATVVISLLGLFLMRISYLYGVALSASLSVLVTMLASLTLLPALLAFSGRKIDRFRVRVPFVRRRAPAAVDAGRPAFWVRWSRTVQRRPWRALAAGLAVIGVLAIPVTSLRLGFPDAGNDPAEQTTRQAYELISQGFGPGANGPLVVAAELDGAQAADRLTEVERTLAATPGVAAVAPPTVNADGTAAVFLVTPTSSPQDEDTVHLVNRLRDDVLPAATAGTGVRAHVGGQTASFIDQSDVTGERLPLFIAAVVALSFLLLLVVFRSVPVAVKAGIMNMLSLAGAFGIVALVAQGGWAGQLIGIDTHLPIPSWLPVMTFAIVFGLSMDYEVFLLSRIREEYLETGENHEAVARGLASTARVITAAAAIMIAVFGAFILSDQVFLQLVGVGLASAILIDATIVRLVLVPAVMQLLGAANWWVPRWLDRLLPHFEVERAAGLRRPAPEAVPVRQPEPELVG
jgi:RND superfamily putative drug exporter